MATQRLNWRPDGGIVAFVPEGTILPEYDLPPGATRIHLDGKPAFHVTLIDRHVMKPYNDAMATLWLDILADAEEPPVAQLSSELNKACSEEKQKTSWWVHVINADDYSKYLRDLVVLIDRHLKNADKGSFSNPEMDRQFHMTVANNSGDPMDSLSDPLPHS